MKGRDADELFVAAAEGCVRRRSRRNSEIAVHLLKRELRFYDRFAIRRSLRQRLQDEYQAP